MRAGRVLVIGDIHGGLKALIQVLESFFENEVTLTEIRGRVNELLGNN